MTIVEDYVTDRGRKRQRTVTVELDAIGKQLRHPSENDFADWRQIRGELRRIVGESTFEIWLGRLEVAAIDHAGALLLSGAGATRGWVATRFAGGLFLAGGSVGRALRLASDREERLLQALPPATPRLDASSRSVDPIRHDHQEAL